MSFASRTLLHPLHVVLYRYVYPDGHVQMAVEEKLVVLADEVYQANVWKEGASFSSFKKVIENFSQVHA